MTAKKPAPEKIDVEIFGSTYTLRGGSEAEAVRALARKLDGQMRELASPGADPLRVAILAGLRLADETREMSEGAFVHEDEISARIAALTARMEEALRSTAGSASSRAEAGGATLDAAGPVG